MVSVILLVLLGVVLLLIIILSLPVAFSGKVHVAEKVSGEGEVAWAWGLAFVRLGIREGKPDFLLLLTRHVRQALTRRELINTGDGQG